MNQRLLVLKSKAFSIHFGISLVIFFVLLYLIFFHWYPTPFFTTDGGWQGIRLIAFVDIVLGPTLTFIAYNPIKKSIRHLRMDLGLIALFQLTALSWGIWTVHNERPYLVIFSDQAFYGMPYYQIKETGLKKEDLTKLGGDPPIKVFMDIPTQPNERYAFFTSVMKSQQPPHFFSEYYQHFDRSHLTKLIKASIDMEAFMQDKDKDKQERYHQFLKQHAEQVDNFLFFPIHARYGKFIAVLDQEKLEFVDVLDIKPPVIDEWEGSEKYIEKLKKERQSNKNPT